MRIAIVSRYARKGDGQGRANREIALAAINAGHSVDLYADQVDKDILDVGAKWIPVQPKTRSNDLAYGLQSIATANRALAGKRSNYDVIHGYGWTLDGSHHINTAQFVHTAWLRHSMHPSRMTSGPYALYQRLYTTLNAWGERKAFRDARRVIGASSTIRQELTTLCGVADAKVGVVLNGVDLDEFYPGTEDRKSLGLPEDVFLALFAGDIRTGRKNLDTVLKALVKLPDVHLAVAGRVAGSPWPALAADLGLSNRVHFLDFRTDLSRLMRASDCFVFPSRYEACALVLVEALARGLPVITAKTTGGSEAVGPGAGVVIDNTESVEELSAALQDVSARADLLPSRRQAARQCALPLTWANIGAAYIEHYADVAG
jgi:glycosyltransferase involved in cell wall biosynthesis